MQHATKDPLSVLQHDSDTEQINDVSSLKCNTGSHVVPFHFLYILSADKKNHQHSADFSMGEIHYLWANIN